jgi:hypothetical protein
MRRLPPPSQEAPSRWSRLPQPWVLARRRGGEEGGVACRSMPACTAALPLSSRPSLPLRLSLSVSLAAQTRISKLGPDSASRCGDVPVTAGRQSRPHAVTKAIITPADTANWQISIALPPSSPSQPQGLRPLGEQARGLRHNRQCNTRPGNPGGAAAPAYGLGAAGTSHVLKGAAGRCTAPAAKQQIIRYHDQDTPV